MMDMERQRESRTGNVETFSWKQKIRYRRKNADIRNRIIIDYRAEAISRLNVPVGQAKVVPGLNHAQHHEDVWGSGGAVLKMHNRSTR
jgi:hypothetical protein